MGKKKLKPTDVYQAARWADLERQGFKFYPEQGAAIKDKGKPTEHIATITANDPGA